ncbi:PRC-barrel domain-containing protein [Sphingomonas lenta]|uniref:Photosystem reaction center subunit H n=1 Tax=Sphingomonas lenta TaxID=1141887 RepID=A0A2A2SET3_9SPHN|nr:PRC-barrel domain-containing protein [Sphingomonas lenta]PAX07758.1 photosystem reaction center subunit H [Sphingomonas lenta]
MGNIGEIAGWLALAATSVAALMTASNLGARVTGWGFVVFTVGAVCWILLGWSQGEAGRTLVISNAFLFLVNLVGIYRWLGRQARYSDGSRRAMKRSERTRGPSLMSACTLLNAPINDLDGDKLATVVDAMLSREGRDIVYLVASRGGVGGVGEKLHPIDPNAVELGADGITTRLSGEEIDRLPVLEPDRWPAELPREARVAA